MTAALTRAAGIDETAAGIAADLAGAPVSRLAQLGGGRNSRVYRVETEAAYYALKLYPADETGRDRIGVETTVLRWMELHDFTMVPRLIAADHYRGAALLSWEAGDPVGAPAAADIAQACSFLRRLHEGRRSPALPPGHLAAEACLSGAEIEWQLRTRLAALRTLRDPALTTFLNHQVEPALTARLEPARAAMKAACGSFDAELPQTERSPVPADFGFHNALRRADGRLTFIDFDYFGWDDPAKLIGDLLLHPATALDAAARATLLAGARGIYTKPGFAARLAALLPLLGLRWALILLNEFHPERWRRRIAAGQTGSWEDAKRRQLEAARRMLTRHIIPEAAA